MNAAIRRSLAVMVSSALMIAVAACSSGSSKGQTSSSSSPPSSAPAAGAPSNTVWLCRPGKRPDPCTADLTTTVTPAGKASGADHVEHYRPASDPPIDCFYVYPTVSAQSTVNANLRIDPEEIGVAQQQASQFSRVCRVFAPMYPQLTLKAITSSGSDLAKAAAKAYAGVRSAWLDYLAHDNHGRGVVLIGHSQGAGMLTELIHGQIDRHPVVRRRLVSALLIGGNVIIPAGKRVGGSFQHVPACTSNRQTGCVVAYSSFDQPPPANTNFGRAGGGVSRLQPGLHVAHPEVLCTNPAALGGGTGKLHSMYRKTAMPGVLGTLTVSMFGGHPPVNATAWTEQNGAYEASCQRSGGANVLMIRPLDSNPLLTPEPDPSWGLHLVDVNLALGNLVATVASQAKAYR